MKTTVKVVVTKYYKRVGLKVKAPKSVTLTINNPDDWKTIIDAANTRLHDNTINALTLHFVKEVETL